MALQVRLADDVAKLRGWTGTRRRTVKLADGSSKTFIFGRRPIEVPELYPEIAADPKLIVVSPSVTVNAVFAPSTAGDVAAVSPPPLPSDPAALPIADLRALAQAHGVETTGNKSQIIARLTRAVNEPIPADDEQG